MMIEDIAAKFEIQQLVYKYCRAIDRRDMSLLATLYAENSTDEHGGMFTGSGAEYVEWVGKALENVEHTSHQVFNHLIELDPNDSNYAEGEVYTFNVHIVTGENGEQVNLSTGSRYLDKYIKTDQGWQFLHRKTVADYTVTLPVPAGELVNSLRQGAPVGGIKQQDPSHDYFRLIRHNSC